jgi:hypothetical protein
MAKVKGCGFSGRAVRNAFTAPADAVALMAPRRSDVSGVCILFPGEAIPRASSRGGLLVAPSGRHPKGEMHSAKTFCVPQKLSSPPFPSALRRCSFALCRERTHQGDGQPSPQEKTRMHTRNVNVKTAAQESSRKMGKNKTLFLSHGSGWLRPLR